MHQVNSSKGKRYREIWASPEYTKEDVRSIQALSDYAAGGRTLPPEPKEVKKALDWIINVASAHDDVYFKPGQGDVLAFLTGRRFVGANIIKLMKLKIGVVFPEDER